MSSPPGGSADILLVSNGYGEAAIATYLARAIHGLAPGATVEHFPMVGRATSTAHLRSVGPQAEMPSGGLVAYWNVRNFVRDVGAGLLSLTARQFAYLGEQRGRSVVVAVGDVYCCAAALLFARRPTIFVATAKSEYVAPHSAFECAIARRARVVFTRDAVTAAALARRGVNARYAGNLMMDGVAGDDVDLPLRPGALHVGVLPGSRSDAPENAAAALRRLRYVAAMLAPQPVQAFVSVAPAGSSAEILAAADSAGIPLARIGAGAPIAGADDRGVIARGVDGSLDVLVVRGGFGGLLRASDIVLGQAGTGNEQAAGLGKPVIASSAAGDPGRIGWYRMRQQRLLGDALLVLGDDDRGFAAGVVALVRDPARMQEMGAVGRQRMGGPGGSAVVAQAVLALASETSA